MPQTSSGLGAIAADRDVGRPRSLVRVVETVAVAIEFEVELLDEVCLHDLIAAAEGELRRVLSQELVSLVIREPGECELGALIRLGPLLSADDQRGISFGAEFGPLRRGRPPEDGSMSFEVGIVGYDDRVSMDISDWRPEEGSVHLTTNAWYRTDLAIVVAITLAFAAARLSGAAVVETFEQWDAPTFLAERAVDVGTSDLSIAATAFVSTQLPGWRSLGS
jgi:hypothetical protein